MDLSPEAIDFFIKHKAKAQNTRNRLLPYKKDIIGLKSAGLSYQQIASFLEGQGVKITIASLSTFYRKHSNESIKETKIQKQASTPAQSEPSKTKHSNYIIPSWADQSRTIDDII